MPTRCHDDAVEIFAPHVSNFAELIHGAVRDVYTRFGAEFHDLERRTQASIIRDKIVAGMKLYAEETTGLQKVRSGNATYFGFQSRFLIKLKRLGKGFQPNVGGTQAALQFDQQSVPERDAELMAHLDATTVYVGYIPTENDPLNPPVYIVCKNEKGAVDWVIECKPPIPSAPIELKPEAPATPSKRRVRVKLDRKSGTDD